MQHEQYGSVFEMVDNRLEKIEQSLNTIKTDVALVKDRQVAVIADMSGLKTTIYGNGQPGLVTKVALIWQRVVLISSGVGVLVSSLVALAVNSAKR